ncbi:hypothetical protein LZC95_08125 [Pendulispora brunnea]|uniref:Uncharacterized protein n=1 Tax=Pendulispora brunnea TaxID=2905690 RepID=A0ABZ2KGY0_9BACT
MTTDVELEALEKAVSNLEKELNPAMSRFGEKELERELVVRMKVDIARRNLDTARRALELRRVQALFESGETAANAEAAAGHVGAAPVALVAHRKPVAAPPEPTSVSVARPTRPGGKKSKSKGHTKHLLRADESTKAVKLRANGRHPHGKKLALEIVVEALKLEGGPLELQEIREGMEKLDWETRATNKNALWERICTS